MEGLTVGEVAKQAHVGIETLRYYERRGVEQATAQEHPEQVAETRIGAERHARDDPRPHVVEAVDEGR